MEDNFKGYKNSEYICTKYGISNKSFYNVRNTDQSNIKTKNQWRKVFYNEDDFLNVLKTTNLYPQIKDNIKDNIQENVKLEGEGIKNDVDDANLDKSSNNWSNSKKNSEPSNNLENNLYVEQLLKSIEELKEDKNTLKWESKEDKEKFEAVITELRDELKEESKKVEKAYFISDRYDKVLNTQNELLLNFLAMSEKLQSWWQIALSDIKTLLTQYSIKEGIQLDPKNADVKFITNTNPEYISKVNKIDSNIVIEKSNREEVNKLKKNNNFKNILLALFVLFILVYFSIVIFLEKF